jgi:hypothetical protein
VNAVVQPIEPAPSPAVIPHPNVDVATMQRALSIRLDAMERRLEEGDTRMGQIERGLQANTESTQRVEKNTGDMLDAFNSLRGGFKVLQFVGKVAAPVGAIIGAAAAAWAAWKAR